LSFLIYHPIILQPKAARLILICAERQVGFFVKLRGSFEQTTRVSMVFLINGRLINEKCQMENLLFRPAVQ